MNREILFGGKRLDNGEWVTGRLITDDRDGKEFIVSWIGYHCEEGIDSVNRYIECFGFEVDPETVGQYTGLKDRNGVKIWEGDVFHLDDPNILYVVAWQDAGFVGRQRGNRSSVGLSYWAPYLEKVGNVHDNPELLEVLGDG